MADAYVDHFALESGLSITWTCPQQLPPVEQMTVRSESAGRVPQGAEQGDRDQRILDLSIRCSGCHAAGATRRPSPAGAVPPNRGSPGPGGGPPIWSLYEPLPSGPFRRSAREPWPSPRGEVFAAGIGLAHFGFDRSAAARRSGSASHAGWLTGNPSLGQCRAAASSASCTASSAASTSPNRRTTGPRTCARGSLSRGKPGFLDVGNGY